MTVIARARENSAVETLYQEVDGRTPITVDIVGGRSWSSKTQNGRTHIEAATAQDPAAALYHELLHAELKNRGYRQYNMFLFTNHNSRKLKNIIGNLDNELQHHRMFARFTDAGFTGGSFYADGNDKDFEKIRCDLRKMNERTPVSDFLPRLLTAIAPGGHGTADDRRKLRKFMAIRAGDNKNRKLEAIEAHIKAWATSTVIDPGPTLRAIVQVLGDCDGAWIGASENFPDDGFFTGAAFAFRVAEDYHRAAGLIQ